MMENDTITKDKITWIREILSNNFDIETEYLGDGVIGISELNGYINSEERYDDIEYLGENIVEWLRQNYDYDFSYDILHIGYELAIQVL